MFENGYLGGIERKQGLADVGNTHHLSPACWYPAPISLSKFTQITNRRREIWVDLVFEIK